MFEHNITEFFRKQTLLLTIQSEGNFTPGKQEWSCFNSGGVEVEVAEFLYSLTKMVKPGFIVETGTHLGISSSYMAQACKENNKGSLWTYEVIPELYQQASQLWSELGVQNFINGILQPSLEAVIPSGLEIDLLFLDSEPQYRFDEFVKFWDNVSPGGFVVIHDMDESIGHHGQTHHGVYDWPYGNYRGKIGRFIKENLVQMISFPTPRGVVLLQKLKSNCEYKRFLDGK